MIRYVPLIVAIVMALSLDLVVSNGQDTKAPTPEVPKVKAPALPPHWKALNLTADQKVQIHKVQTEYKAKIKVLELQIKDLHTAEYADMVKVLTAPQKEELRKALVPDDKKPDDTKKPETK